MYFRLLFSNDSGAKDMENDEFFAKKWLTWIDFETQFQQYCKETCQV